MTDTPQSAWMREYGRRRSDLENAAYDVGDARNGEEEERAEAVAAKAHAALDAHVRGLVEENERLRGAVQAGIVAIEAAERRIGQADAFRVTREKMHAALATPKDAP